MCKNWENGQKWPTLRKSAWATNTGLRNGLARTPARFARANQGLRGRSPPEAASFEAIARLNERLKLS